MEFYQQVERSLITTYRKTVWNKFIEGVKKYQMVNEGDKIAVCISGGKDSMILAKLMQELQRHGEKNFELRFIVMDPGYNPKNRQKIIDNAKLLNIPIEIFDSPIFNTVTQIEKNPCYLCARMRRGYLYAKAQELGCNKIALGHHFSDVIETIVMGMFYGAQVQTMMPKLHSTNFPGMELIRPLYCVHEDHIIAWKNYNKLEFLQCACRFTEERDNSGDGIGDSKRQLVKQLIKELRKDDKQIEINIFRSVEDVNLGTLIGYHKDDEFYNFLDDYDKK